MTMQVFSAHCMQVFSAHYTQVIIATAIKREGIYIPFEYPLEVLTNYYFVSPLHTAMSSVIGNKGKK